jgi:hypothetical protein
MEWSVPTRCWPRIVLKSARERRPDPPPLGPGLPARLVLGYSREPSDIYDGAKQPERAYRASSGVTAALLRRHGIPVISQRDIRSLYGLRATLDSTFTPDPNARD